MKQSLTLALVVGLIFNACGQGLQQHIDDEDKEQKDTTPIAQEESLVQDTNLNQEAVEANLTDALEALADSNAAKTTTSFALFSRKITDNSTFEKKCEAKEGTAYVTIDASIDRNLVIETPRRKRTKDISGEGHQERTWSSESKDIPCAENGHHALPSWEEAIPGLKLAVKFERSKDVNVEMLYKRPDNSFTRKKSFSAKGTREISWLSHEENEVENTVTLEKIVTSDVTRNHTRKTLKGKEIEFELNVKTKEDAALNIIVVRNKNDKTLTSKTIKSGTLIGTRKLDGHVESSFEDLKIDFDGQDCQVISGVVTSQFFKEGEEEPAKSFKLQITNGEYVLTNVETGEEIEDFELPGCALKDFVK